MKKRICSIITVTLLCLSLEGTSFAQETMDDTADILESTEEYLHGDEWVGLLPIGSIVLLKNSEKKLMVMGYLQSLTDGEDDKMYDYSACLFPEGYISADEVYLLDQEQIDVIYYIGYQDEEQMEFMQRVYDYIENIQG